MIAPCTGQFRLPDPGPAGQPMRGGHHPRGMMAVLAPGLQATIGTVLSCGLPRVKRSWGWQQPGTRAPPVPVGAVQPAAVAGLRRAVHAR